MTSTRKALILAAVPAVLAVFVLAATGSASPVHIAPGPAYPGELAAAPPAPLPDRAPTAAAQPLTAAGTISATALPGASRNLPGGGAMVAPSSICVVEDDTGAVVEC